MSDGPLRFSGRFRAASMRVWGEKIDVESAAISTAKAVDLKVRPKVLLGGADLPGRSLTVSGPPSQMIEIVLTRTGSG